jgi:hypothetical protein
MLELDIAAEMTSAPKRFSCPYCEVVFERDSSGLLTKVDEPERRAADTRRGVASSCAMTHY